MGFRSIKSTEINDNVVQIIGHEWMLITAGNSEDFNTMTAAWGGIGFLWNKPMATIFIRPQRYTYDFVEKNETFSLCFFDKQHHDILQFCGTKSGRDTDKIAETGLIPVTSELGNIYFEQARLVVECRKVYFDDIKPEGFLDPDLKKIYPSHDYHRMYIGFITNCMIKD